MWVKVALDADGTPLWHGERMIEVEPGHWQDPLTVAAEKFIRERIDQAIAALKSADPQVTSADEPRR